MKSTEKIISQARERGSTATTLRGAARWLVSHPERVTPLPFPETVPAYRYRIERKRVEIRKFTPQERDFRRAKNDAGFRRGFVRSLRYEVERILAVDWSPGAISAVAVDWSRRVGRVGEIARILTDLGCRSIPSIDPKFSEHVSSRAVRVDCGLETAHRVGCPTCMRGKDAEIVMTFCQSWVDTRQGWTTWKHGRPVAYSRAENKTFVRSFAILTEIPSGTITVALHDHEYVVTCPDGRWEIDDNGLKLVIGPDDYHPDAAELIVENAGEKLVEKLVENARIRRETAAKFAAEASESEGVMVCARDSSRAGNCISGTENWARNHGLDPARHYAPLDLLTRSNGDVGRVRLAIKAATIRHREEMDRGYSVIADHVGGDR